MLVAKTHFHKKENNMDKKTIVALLLILVVYWISAQFLWKPKQQNKLQETEKIEIENSAAEIAEDNDVPPIEFQAKSSSDIKINENIVLENDFLLIHFSNLGGVVKSIQLKKFFLNDKTQLVEIIPESAQLLNIKLIDNSESIINLQNAVFDFSIAENTISFFTKINQQTIEKTFSLGEKYNVELDFRIADSENLSGYELAFDSGIADSEKYLKMKTTNYQTVYQVANEQKETKLGKLKEERKLEGKVDWTAIKSKYFTMAIIPNSLINTKSLSIFKNNESPAASILIAHDKSSLNHHFDLYFGPLDYDNLVAYKIGLENVVELGWRPLQWIGKIFKMFLNFLSGFISNWGIVIIIFAIILKMILYPLTHKSFESTTKMQKIQPLIKEVQAKYKSDPQKMNVEMRSLYKEHGVNPLGGCLPMLLQMPIIFALYPILRYSISLRQANFLWLPDLSKPDPIWALPILMSVFMFVQQKLMAPSKNTLDKMDEKAKATQQSQKMMMYLMPIMMFFIFKGLASGLVLYWTVFSIIGSVQQYYIKKKFI